MTEIRVCAADGCTREFSLARCPTKGRNRKYCGDACSQATQARRRRERERLRNVAPYRDDDATVDPPLPEPIREYLRLFDRAIKERTPEAWAACREFAPGMRRPFSVCKLQDVELAELLWLLEA